MLQKINWKITVFSYLAFALIGLPLAFHYLNKVNREYRKAGFGYNSPQGFIKGGGTLSHAEKDGLYNFQYHFKAINSKAWTWQWSYYKQQVDRDIEKFGIPKFMFQPFIMLPEVKLLRNFRIKSGMFLTRDNLIQPDFESMVNYYRPYGKVLYEMMLKTLKNPTRQEKIQFLLHFTQDINYGVPDDYKKDIFTGGVLSPVEIFINGWGDCDSKAVLFASILSHDPSFKMVFITVPKHLLLGIEGTPKPYQNSVKFRGKSYILAEPVGTRRTVFGKTNDKYSTILNITPIRIRN